MALKRALSVEGWCVCEGEVVPSGNVAWEDKSYWEFCSKDEVGREVIYKWEWKRHRPKVGKAFQLLNLKALNAGASEDSVNCCRFCP